MIVGVACCAAALGLLRMFSPAARWARQSRPGHSSSERADAALKLGYDIPDWQRDDAFRTLTVLVKDDDPHVRASAAHALTGHRAHSAEVLALLLGLLQDESSRVRQGALFAIEQLVTPRSPEVATVIPALVTALDDPSAAVRLEAARALYVIGRGELAAEALARLVREEQGAYRLGALGFLQTLGIMPAELEPTLRAMSVGPHAMERLQAAVALIALGKVEVAKPVLREMLEAGAPWDRLRAAEVLIGLGESEAAITVLREISNTELSGASARADVLLDRLARSAPVGTPVNPDARSIEDWREGRFRWTASAPLIAPADRPDDPCHAIKDPSVVEHDGRWHLFCTIRGSRRSHQIEYLTFEDWTRVDRAERHVLKLTDGYFCAPQVFYFRPHAKWYLIYQVSEPSRKPELQPAFSTTDSIGDPGSWTRPTLLFEEPPENVAMWIDFWVICDEHKAHLFFTSLDGRMWRSETALGDFPRGWSRPSVVLEGDIFEASHTYKLKGTDQYLTLVEAQGEGGRRYYKAYRADRLDGDWTPLAATADRPFAGPSNVAFAGDRWTDSFSHGELLRAGHDERLEVDPNALRFLFQGVSDDDRRGKPYGAIPWRLGLLEPARSE
jgi:HEAT repeat protein